jgi:uncharacterized protein (DUF1697 family)
LTGRHVALIRGINVGTAKRVAMADLRAMVEGLGYRDVSTLLNSGNVVFTVPPGAKGEPGARLEEGMTRRLKVSARIVVITAAELAAVVKANPLAKVATNPSRYMVAFLANPADRALLVPLAKQDWKPDSIALGTRAAYIWCANGQLESRAAEAVGRALKDAVTVRNWATVTKLHALAGATGAS